MGPVTLPTMVAILAAILDLIKNYKSVKKTVRMNIFLP